MWDYSVACTEQTWLETTLCIGIKHVHDKVAAMPGTKWVGKTYRVDIPQNAREHDMAAHDAFIHTLAQVHGPTLPRLMLTTGKR